nr:MAG TPA: Transcriptional regulator BINDING, PHEROMONE BINDING, REPEAT [Caudoviricetes sp.]
MNYFSKNISYLLDKKEITVDSILKITNHTSRGLVSMWKSGERQAMTDDIVAIANHLNLTVDDLINKDLSKKENSYDELSLLFSKHRDILTEEDEETMKFLIEKRKREIDKQNNE